MSHRTASKQQVALIAGLYALCAHSAEGWADPPSGQSGRSKDPAPQSLSWNGITLYGTIDVGIAYVSHGAPLSPTYGPGLPFTLSSYSNHPITSLAPNGL